RLVAAVGMSQTHGDSVAISVPVQALVSYVQALSIAVEQLPRPGRGEMALGVGVGRVIHQGRQFIPASRFHRSFRGTGGVVNAQSILYWYNMEPAPRQRIRAVPAVTRAVAILRLLDRADAPMGVNAIARELDLVPSTCLHILRALTEEELVAVDPATKRYTLEAGIVSLARRALRRDSFSNAVQPELDRLARRHGLTTIGVRVVGLEHMIVVAISHADLGLRLHVDLGSRFPALISATGRCFAAFGDHPVEELERRF